MIKIMRINYPAKALAKIYHCKVQLHSEPHQAKAIEPLNPFCFAIEKRHPSKYSLWQKRREREKKTMLVYL